MKILETRVMKGPSQWSVIEKKLIVMKVSFSQKTQGIPERAVEEYPQLFDGCSVTDEQLPDDLAHLIAHVALFLQRQAGMKTNFGMVEDTREPEEKFIVFSYEVEQVGEEAGRQALMLINDLMLGLPPAIEKYTTELRRLREHYSLGPTSRYILDEVQRRGIPFWQFGTSSLVTLGYGSRQKKLRTAVTSMTSGLGIELAGDKEETKHILDEASCPIPRGIVVYSEAELRSRISEVRFPLVIKPLDGNHGRGVTTNISSVGEAVEAFSLASRISSEVIIEEFIQGEDYRFLVVNYKLVAASKRSPATVIGDGVSAVSRLIELENENVNRGNAEHHVLARIKVDHNTRKMLDLQGLSLNSIPERGRKVVLKDTANISSGGTAEDVTDTVHPATVFMVERIARIFNLDVCGIDIVARTVTEPLTRSNGAVIEVNAGPGLRMHSNPQSGRPRDIASPIIDMLFKDKAEAKIPVIAVTGTNGKTTTTRLIAHLASAAGFTPGYCTSDGIYIDHFPIRKGDCTGFISSRNVLFDPSIDFAVLECARGGIIRHGLAFNECNVAVITNITEDHLGLKDIYSVDELARVKFTVAQTVPNEGFAVLNADDKNVMKIYSRLSCKSALFARTRENPHVVKHLEKGGICAFSNGADLLVYEGEKPLMIIPLKDVPLTFNGQAGFMVANVMASVLAALVSGFPAGQISKGLSSFLPSAELTPGRMNKFDFPDFSLIVDYAHNSDGFRKVADFIQNLQLERKTAVIAVAGDRRETDIMEIGRIVARIFDRIIIRYNAEERGKGNGEVARMLKESISQEKEEVYVMIIPGEREALSMAISEAAHNELIFVCADKVPDTLQLVKDLQEKYQEH